MADDWFDNGAWSFLGPADSSGLPTIAAEPAFTPSAGSSTFDNFQAAAPSFSFGVPASFAPAVDAGLPTVDLAQAFSRTGFPSASAQTAPVADLARFVGGVGAPESFGDVGGAAAPFLGYDRQTGHLVDVRTGAVILDARGMRELTDNLKGGNMQRVAEILKPVNAALNTSLGGTLAALGLGAAGIGLARSVAGDAGRFRAPARVQGVGMNPAAQALMRDIRMRNLQGLNTLTPDAATSGDPITVDLAGRLRKALAGEISNPGLDRANRLEREQLETRMLRRTGGSPLWDQTSAGIEARARLDESQAIRRYLDNQNTIAQLDPAVRARQSEESNRLARLSGIDTFDADRQFENQLGLQLAQNEYLQDRSDRADLAKGIAAIFGTAASGLTGGSRRPWDRPGL